ncbi:MAG: L-serine ammonia-lyase, iron-sulfur-dependent, subunit alpha [Anaerolineae bacterium]|nr:L-serine ammonia-lyase, iron-sulfur-dependent, subunit alpha [Anaerolineae bacterium]
MKQVSILNDVLGPVMRGPSSSHTAAPFYIGAMARALGRTGLGDEPAAVTFTFDPGGSWAEVYREQGSDRGFAAGILGWTLTDPRFRQSLDAARQAGVEIRFHVAPLARADHPNTVDIRLTGRRGGTLHVVARSIGGGALVFTQVGGWAVELAGDTHEVLVELEAGEADEGEVARLLAPAEIEAQARDSRRLIRARRRAVLPGAALDAVRALPGVRHVWAAPPVYFAIQGDRLFDCAAQAVALAEERGWSLGRTALAYEAALLDLPESEVLAEMGRRFEVMRAAAERGLGDELPPMQLLAPSAGRIYRAEGEGRLAIGGLHTRAAARAMAVMHVNGGMGVVCAAPTAGSAGTLPGVAVTLFEELGLDEEEIALALLAAGAVGMVVGTRATFAAEVAGCQVEIGASGAMAAAAVVETAGGSARQACDAAAIAFQNTMGSVCDLVQGIVEVPCHTRNAVAASSAFVCADLILGGYHNPVPLDETIDAVYAVGQMLPRELKVTALGGLALAPSALAMERRAFDSSAQ